MKKVRLIFVGIMLALFCVGFTSCGHEADMDPVLTEEVGDGLDIDVRGEEGEEDENGNSGSGSGEKG